MRQVKITLVGLRVIPTPEEEAESKCYWLDDEHSSLAVPATHIHGSLIKGCGRYKVDRQSLWSIIVGACHIEPELISLNTDDYKRHTCTVIIQKNRIFRCRPKVVCPWEIEFEFHFDPEWLPLEVVRQTLPEVIKTSGSLIGIGDFRTEKKGPFGKYYLKRFELLPQREEIPLPEPEIIGFDNFSIVSGSKKPAKKKASA
jgi:hypothetical protein